MIADTYIIDGINLISLPTEIYNKKFSFSSNDEETTINKLINNISNFNISKINKNINTSTTTTTTNNFFIEFYFGTQINNEVNFVKHKDFFPLVSSMTILEDFNDKNDTNNNLNIFTNINFKSYKYKKYRKLENGKKIITTTLKKNRHIIYNGENANIFINKNENNITPIILFINIWDKKVDIDDKNIQTNDINLSIDSINIIDSIKFTEESIQQIELNNDLSSNFYENILYNKDNNCLNFLLMILQEHEYKNIEFIDKYDIKNEETKKLKIKYGDVINDIQDINKSYIKQNRFYQRFTTKILSSEICKWIINETEEYVDKYGWDRDTFKNYPTYDLKLSKITKIHDYFLNYELGKIMSYIEKSYCLPVETKFNITDLNIIKYSEDLQTYLENHVDSGLITFNIALNNNTEYEGGGTYFDDGLIFNIDKGEMLVHCGKVIHRGLTITKGVRYILIGFINIIYEA
jgi:hypothetical protein